MCDSVPENAHSTGAYDEKGEKSLVSGISIVCELDRRFRELLLEEGVCIDFKILFQVSVVWV
jgi:hypothetical protein